MASPTLSILIATIPSRELMLKDLLKHLSSQYRGAGVEIITNGGMSYNIGAKRNMLLDSAMGEYVVFIDDDDTVSDNYVEAILKAAESGTDCIGISGTITINGGAQQQWHISKDYGKWYEKDSIFYRTPNHISPVRREIALMSKFPEVSFGEDFKYSMRVLPYLRTETKITGNIYNYEYIDKELI